MIQEIPGDFHLRGNLELTFYGNLLGNPYDGIHRLFPSFLIDDNLWLRVCSTNSADDDFDALSL